jgi:hypothetical protein
MLTDTARKKFKFQVVPSDRQLWAIGMVAVTWTGIEFMVITQVHALTEKADREREIFDSTHSMDSRLDQWEELARRKIMQPWQTDLLRLVNEAKQVKELRDKIIHGMWGGKQNEGPPESGKTEAHGPFRWGKPHAPFSWKLDYGGILQVALRIDMLQAQLFEFCFQAAGVKHGDSFMFDAALKRISRKPDQP